ncbi:NfrA family protein [Deefgea rivuli]|uniref:NfrA family protein n=1 Tax=Deefgea rivuli TaxID=400948 RepID=UPI00055A5DF3|nr:hypothetical protein [Deefgea rivuli]
MMRRSRLRFSPILLLLLTLAQPAQANWARDKWTHFRSYPRMERAYSLLNQGDLAGARKLFEQVYRIDPARKDVTLELARICARQHDNACIKQLAQSWRQRSPKDAMGYMLLAYAGYLTGDNTLFINNAPLALQRSGISEQYRSTLAEAWLASLIRQGASTQAAMQLIQQQKINISSSKLKQWEAQRQASQLALKAKSTPQTNPKETPIQVSPSSTPQAPATAQAIPTRTPAARQTPQPIVQQPSPTPAPTFPYALLPAAQRNARLSADFHQLAQDRNYEAILTRLAKLQQAQLFTPQLQELLANTLQAKHCHALLKLIAVDSYPKSTTTHSQMAAAFCSQNQNDPLRAAAHFAAVNRLHQQAGEALDFIAARGEIDALLAAGKTETAMQQGYALLQQQNNPALGQALANLALQHPNFAISHDIAQRFPQYFPKGALALNQARQALRKGDSQTAIDAFQRSLAEKPNANVWYELALLYAYAEHHAEQGAALAQAVLLAPEQALFHAEYGFWLIHEQRPKAALEHLELAIELDPQRIALKPQIALLKIELGQHTAAIIDLRSSITQHEAIQAQLGISGDAAAQQLFNWQRNVQTLEDRWSWSIHSQIRLNKDPDNKATSPVQYAQYNGTLDIEAAYRLTPIWDTARPTWLFARANQGLEDQSLRTSANSASAGIGLRQRLLKDHVLIASAEWLRRNDAVYRDDAMLRLSGSQSLNTDWQPTGAQWRSINLYGDLAWLVRAESYYVTAAIEAGEQYRLPWLSGKSTFMPFISSIATANTDNSSHTVVSRVDVGAGVALQTWHGGDAWRAPDLRQRLSLEVRQAIAGNSDDRFAVLLHWGLFH